MAAFAWAVELYSSRRRSCERARADACLGADGFSQSLERDPFGFSRDQVQACHERSLQLAAHGNGSYALFLMELLTAHGRGLLQTTPECSGNTFHVMLLSFCSVL